MCQGLFGSDSVVRIELEHFLEQIDGKRIRSAEHGTEMFPFRRWQRSNVISCLEFHWLRSLAVLLGLRKEMLTLSDDIFDMKSSDGVPRTSIIRLSC